MVIFLSTESILVFEFYLFLNFLAWKLQDLRQVKGITATYRMTNKPLPVRHSPYVTGVLRPLKVFSLVNL